MTQHFVGSAVYALPFGQGRKYGANCNRCVNGVLGGWRVGPTNTASAGLPLNLTVNGNPSNSEPYGAVRANVVGGWQLANPTVQEWFNTAALAAHMQFRVSERFTAQLRLESFNATNTQPFAFAARQPDRPKASVLRK
jgi:hypothetical protein